MAGAPLEHRHEPLGWTADAPPEAAGVAPGALSALLAELARAPSTAEGSASLPPLAGASIGRFQLVRELGRGGFGVVYEARDTELQRSVAFKLVRPGRLLKDGDQARSEAEVIARFSHPNLVTLFDLGQSAYGPYLVLELLQGQTLQAWLDRQALAPREAWRIAVEIAQGLAHAHARAVVHRDLKPSNVFLTDDGRVKILDFGLSHVFGRQGREGGTPAYMAPEQRRGGPEDERTDVYALGVLLFRAVSGRLPFGSDGGGGPAPRLDLPQAPGLAELVARMLEEEPALRPRNGAEVLAGLQALGPGLGQPGNRRRRRLAAGALLALALLLGGALAARQWGRRGAPAPRLRTIAVLPFESSSTPGLDYLGEGLAEDIANRLVRLRELRVAASASSVRFRDRTQDPARVAERLGVDVLLLGSVRRDGGRLRIATELVEPRDGLRLWSEVYDREAADVLAVQNEIARRVASAMEVVLSRASEGLLGTSSRVSVAAYDAYLRGKEALRRPVTRESLDLAAALFEEAMAREPALAQAHAGLCDARLAMYARGRSVEQFDRAGRACRAALDRDPEAAEVRVALGNLQLTAGRADDAEREFRLALQGAGTGAEAWVGLAGVRRARGDAAGAETAFAEAERIDPTDWRTWQQHGHLLFQEARYADAAARYREVLRLTPENASALNNLGAALYLSGDPEGATPAYRRSLALAPSSTAHSNLGTALFYAGRFEEAAAAYRSATELAPEDYQPWGNLGDACTFAPGRQAEATRAYARAVGLARGHLRVNPADAEATAELARFQARLGRAAEARRLRSEALGRAPRSVYVHYNAAVVAAQLGEVDQALATLERAVALGYPARLLPGDAAFSAMREDRRFVALGAPRGPEQVDPKGGSP